MKRLFSFCFLFFSIATWAQPEAPYRVQTITQLKQYFGASLRVHVTDMNADFAICSPCTADEVTVFAGAAGKKWKRVSGLRNDSTIGPNYQRYAYQYYKGRPGFYPVKSDEGVFYVDDFGATPNDTLSDQSAIQATLNAAHQFALLRGNAKVKFSPGRYLLKDTVKMYAPSGSLVNAQIYIPGTSTSDPAVSITLEGTGEPSWEHSVLVDWSQGTGGTVIESTIHGTTPGRPALLGTEYRTTFFGQWNMTDVTVRNLTFRNRSIDGATHVQNNMDGLNFQLQSIVTLENVRVDIQSEPVFSAYQGHFGSVGIYMPIRDNAAWNAMRNVMVVGYSTGLWAAEHVNADNLTIAGCTYGIKAGLQNHTMHFNRVLFNGNINNIFVEGDVYMTISNLSTEHYNGHFGPKWYAFNSDIIITAGKPRMDIRYHVVQSGLSTSADSLWRVDYQGGDTSLINAYPIGKKTVAGGGGSVSLPANQIATGTGAGLSSTNNFVWNGQTLRAKSNYQGGVLELQHASGTAPWQFIAGFVGTDDFAIQHNGNRFLQFGSDGAVKLPSKAQASSQMLYLSNTGDVLTSPYPFEDGSSPTGSGNIPTGNGSGQFRGSNKFTWNGATLGMVSDFLGATVTMKHAAAGSPWKLRAGHVTADDFAILEDETTRLAIAPGGNVGVGTTSPGQKLSVAGTIETTMGGVKFPDGSVQTKAALTSAQFLQLVRDSIRLKLDTADFFFGNDSVLNTKNRIESIYKKAGTDSVFVTLNGQPFFAFRDSAGGGSGGGTPAGADGEVQFNNAGSFGSSSNFTYNSSVLTAPYFRGNEVTGWTFPLLQAGTGNAFKLYQNGDQYGMYTPNGLFFSIGGSSPLTLLDGSVEVTGDFKLTTVPATSTGGYSVLTYNAANQKVEKVTTAYACYQRLSTKTYSTAVAEVIGLDTELSEQGITHTGSSEEITLDKPGVYKIDFTAHFGSTSTDEVAKIGVQKFNGTTWDNLPGSVAWLRANIASANGGMTYTVTTTTDNEKIRFVTSATSINGTSLVYIPDSDGVGSIPAFSVTISKR